MRIHSAVSFFLTFLVVAPFSQGNAAEANKAHLSYVVVIDKSPAQVVDIGIEPSSTKNIKLTAGYSLSLMRGDIRTPVVSELKTESGQVLHKRQTWISEGQRLKVAYLICGGQVTHISPAPDKIPQC